MLQLTAELRGWPVLALFINVF